MKRYYHKIGERKIQDPTPWDKIFERGKQRKPLVTLWMRHEKPKEREIEKERRERESNHSYNNWEEEETSFLRNERGGSSLK